MRPSAHTKSLKPAHKSGCALGTHRFQRAVSARGALGNNGPSNRDCTLEAMRTQGAE